MVSEIFKPKRWTEVEGFNFEDITYHRAKDQAQSGLPLIALSAVMHSARKR